jgi:hypothetical protein
LLLILLLLLWQWWFLTFLVDPNRWSWNEFLITQKVRRGILHSSQLATQNSTARRVRSFCKTE